MFHRRALAVAAVLAISIVQPVPPSAEAPDPASIDRVGQPGELHYGPEIEPNRYGPEIEPSGSGYGPHIEPNGLG